MSRIIEKPKYVELENDPNKRSIKILVNFYDNFKELRMVVI